MGRITSIPLKTRQSIPIMDDDEIRKARCMKVSFVNKVKFTTIKKLYRKAKLPGDDSSQKMPHAPA